MRRRRKGERLGRQVETAETQIAHQKCHLECLGLLNLTKNLCWVVNRLHDSSVMPFTSLPAALYYLLSCIMIVQRLTCHELTNFVFN